jgi:exodeoxyribonuclease VII large subunit
MQTLDLLAHRLTSPQERLMRLKQDLRHWQQHLTHHIHNHLVQQSQKILRLGDAIEHLGPESTLARGYSIVRNAQGEIVRNAAQLQTGEALELSLAQGAAQVRVENVREG